MEMTFRGREKREFKKKKITAEILKDTRKDLTKIWGANRNWIQSKKDQTILKKSRLEYK